METLPGTVTRLLRSWELGNENALNEVINRVYKDLHLKARALRCSMAPRFAFETGDILHDAYPRIRAQQNRSFNNRTHFINRCGGLFRYAILDKIRAVLRRREHEVEVEQPEDLERKQDESLERMFDLVDGLSILIKQHPGPGHAAAFYLLGHSDDDIAKALDCSPRTVRRRKHFVRTWFRRYWATGECCES